MNIDLISFLKMFGLGLLLLWGMILLGGAP